MTTTTIQMNANTESHAISGVAMAGEASDGANVHHITDGGSSRNSNNNQIVEDSSNIGAACISANAKRRIMKNAIRIRKRKKSAHKDAILTHTTHLTGDGGAGLRNKSRCQQGQPQCQPQCPNWCKREMPEQCPKSCQSPCGECPRRRHCCHRFSPGAWWWFWAQRQRQMQQQENQCSNWWPCEGRRGCMTPNQPPCRECPRMGHCHQHCSPQWRWWFWAQRQRQMQQQQWPNSWGCEMQSQWPQRYHSPCGEWQRRCQCSPGFSPFWFWWVRAERQRQMRRRWLRWFMWKKYMMYKRCQCERNQDKCSLS